MIRGAAHTLASAALAMVLVACGPSRAERDATATQAAVHTFATQTARAPTNTPIPTDTPAATPTDTLTPTPTSTPTATPAPADTATPTPAPTNTPTPTVVPVTPRPTASPVPAEAHVFAETPIQPFDYDVFIRYLGLVRDSLRSAEDEFTRIFAGEKSGSCGSYMGWLALWVTEAPGFKRVPPSWQPLYVEYRSLIRQAFDVTWEIRQMCSAEGGSLSKKTVDACLEFVEWAYPRSEEMVVEALTKPRE